MGYALRALTEAYDDKPIDWNKVEFATTTHLAERINYDAMIHRIGIIFGFDNAAVAQRCHKQFTIERNKIIYEEYEKTLHPIELSLTSQLLVEKQTGKPFTKESYTDMSKGLFTGGPNNV